MTDHETTLREAAENGLDRYAPPAYVTETLARACLAGADALRRGTCEWTDDPSGWQTGCGREWQFINDGPVENRMDYCMGCGKRVVVAPTEPTR